MFHCRCLAFVVGCGMLFCPAVAQAMWILPQLEEVPIDRLVKNLTALSIKNPNDSKLHYNLARVHAMAYASKSDKTEIRKGKEDEGVWFGNAAPHLPFRVVNTKDSNSKASPTFTLGRRWPSM